MSGKQTFNAFLEKEVPPLVGPNRQIYRRVGVCYKNVGTEKEPKMKKEMITSYAQDPINAGLKGGWSVDMIWAESHAKVLANGKTYHNSVWGHGTAGAMKIPRGKNIENGGSYLAKKNKQNSVNVHAFNSCRDPSLPKLCAIDWDHGDNFSDVPKVWQSLPHTRSTSGKFHFYCYVKDVPPTEVRTNQGLFKPDCWNNGVVDVKAADLFIFNKNPINEIDGTEFFNYTGSLPVVEFGVVLEPFLLMDKWNYVRPATLPRAPSLNPTDRSYVTSDLNEPPVMAEVEVLLECIDPARGRFDGWLNVGNFLKFTCEFEDDETRMEMFDDWSKGDWLHGSVVDNYKAELMPKREWDGLSDDQGFDVDYLRKLAQQTDWGMKKYTAYVRKACVKAALSQDNFSRTPYFGEKHVVEIMKKMLPQHVFDEFGKDPSGALYRQNAGGLFENVSTTRMILQVMGEVTDFLELSLKPAIARRAKELEDVMEEDGTEAKALAEKETEYLVGEMSDKGRVVKFGLIHNLEAQIKKLQDGPAMGRTVALFRHTCAHRGMRGEKLSDLWNGGVSSTTAEWLFPFQNGVIDLKRPGEVSFRPARFEEMIYHHSGRFYQPAKREGGDLSIFPGGDVKKWVMDEIWNIYADDDQVMIKLIVTASSLRGRNFFQMFVVETGSGGNGKGTMWKLIRRTFGDLCKELKAQALQKEPSGPDAATSYLARLRHARKVGVKEPKAGDKINLATVKVMTGGDSIPCRNLYQDDTEMVPQFPLEMQCNSKPPLDDSSLQPEEQKAIDRRLLFIVNPFEFDGGEGKNSKPASDTPNIFDTEEDVWDAFFEILVTVFDRYVRPFYQQGVNHIKDVGKLGMGIEYPAYWEQCLKQYKQGRDSVVEFMTAEYVNMLPQGFADLMKGAPFDPTNPAHQKSLSRSGNYMWTFDDSKPLAVGGSLSLMLDMLFDGYLEFCRKDKLKSKNKELFRQRLVTMGYGLTNFDSGGKRFDTKKEFRVFGLGDVMSDPAFNLGESPFDATMSPSKAKGSFYDTILNDRPIKTSDVTVEMMTVPPPAMPAEPDADEGPVDADQYLGGFRAPDDDADDDVTDPFKDPKQPDAEGSDSAAEDSDDDEEEVERWIPKKLHGLDVVVSDQSCEVFLEDGGTGNPFGAKLGVWPRPCKDEKKVKWTTQGMMQEEAENRFVAAVPVTPKKGVEMDGRYAQVFTKRPTLTGRLSVSMGGVDYTFHASTGKVFGAAVVGGKVVYDRPGVPRKVALEGVLAMTDPVFHGQPDRLLIVPSGTTKNQEWTVNHLVRMKELGGGGGGGA